MVGLYFGSHPDSAFGRFNGRFGGFCFRFSGQEIFAPIAFGNNGLGRDSFGSDSFFLIFGINKDLEKFSGECISLG